MSAHFRRSTTCRWRGAGAPTSAIMLTLAACSTLTPVPGDAPILHVLDAKPAAVTPAPARALVLDVGTPRAAPGFDTAAIVYVQKPFALDYYAVHRWVEPPAQMLAPLLVRALEDTGAFRAVVRGAAGVQADARLDTEVLRLQQSFLARPSRVELTLRVQLVDVGSRRVVATRVIDVAKDAPADDPDGGVVAANAAVAQALGEVAAFAVGAATEVAPRRAP